MPGFWQLTARGTASAASVTQNNASGSAGGGQQVRLKAITAYTATSCTLYVTDGATTIFNLDLAAGQQLIEASYDIRSTSNMTIVMGTAAGVNDLNVQGDFVTIGYPQGGSGMV
jgi:hypothetical protein